MKRRAIVFIFAVIMCAAGAAWASPIRKINEIQSPLMSEPALLTAGDNLTIVLKPFMGKSPAAVRISPVADPGAGIDLKAGSVFPSGKGNDDPYPGRDMLYAAVPAGAAVGLYDLTVKFDDGSSDTQPHSVKVIKDFKRDFDFVQLTDIHFNIQRVEGKDMNLIRIRLLEDINALNPEFVLFTGDSVTGAGTHDLDYRTAYDSFEKYLKIPMFMIPGNHELESNNKIKDAIYGSAYWEAMFGPMYQSFDYGALHFTGMNTYDWPEPLRDRGNTELEAMGIFDHACIGNAQWAWAQKDMADAAAAGKNLVVFTHIPVEFLYGGQRVKFRDKTFKVEGPSYQQFMKVMKNDKVPYIFVGHMHMDSVILLSDSVTEIMTMASGMMAPKGGAPEWGFRIVHVKDGKVASWETHKITFDDLK